MRVFVSDARACGFCVQRGILPWLEQQGIDVRDFLKNGIDSEVLLSLNDAFANRVVAKAQERVEAENGRRR